MILQTLRSKPRSASLVLLAIGIVGWAHAKSASKSEEMYAWSKAPVLAPETMPEISQESIDIAIAMFGIEVPNPMNYPTLDTALLDRGTTTRDTLSGEAIVHIGPSAFTSWGLLGSTLAHELEIHCRQNLTLITTLDLLHLDGTGMAEREGYSHELKNARRFGLSHFDRILIRETRDYYYPVAEEKEKKETTIAAVFSRTIEEFLAK